MLSVPKLIEASNLVYDVSLLYPSSPFGGAVAAGD